MELNYGIVRAFIYYTSLLEPTRQSYNQLHQHWTVLKVTFRKYPIDGVELNYGIFRAFIDTTLHQMNWTELNWTELNRATTKQIYVD